jgi:hypothetical protein
MGHRTGTWFQLARGRAMVRNRAMREARIWKERKTQTDKGTSWGRIYDAQGCHDALLAAVRRAREAHRDWRKYRALDAEEAADEAAYQQGGEARRAVLVKWGIR